jgi:hypothetical protein
MPTRIQNASIGLGITAQTNISTPASSTTYIVVPKLDNNIYVDDFGTENNAAWIGKGNEFATQVFPTAFNMAGSMEKYGGIEFMTWAWAGALGNIAYASGSYTLVPINPATTLEMPYFPVVLQLPEGGGMAIDELYVGCSIEEVMTAFQYGPGLQSVKTTVQFAGSGLLTTPSGVTLPATLTEHNALSSSMTLTINGTDYVAGKTILSGVFGWKNNLLLNAGYYPGSGLQDGAAVRGRQEIGVRVPTFTFVARLLHTSPEYAALIAQTTGTAACTLTYDSTHNFTWNWEQISYKMVHRGQADGIATVEVTVQPQYSSSLGILSCTAMCGLTGISA